MKQDETYICKVASFNVLGVESKTNYPALPCTEQEAIIDLHINVKIGFQLRILYRNKL